MNTYWLTQACYELGIDNASIEPDGTIWTGADDARTYLTASQTQSVVDKASDLYAAKIDARQAVLDRLGLTADEVKALLS